MELHIRRLTAPVDQAESVHTEALHHPKAPRDRPVGHDPHDHVHRFRGQRYVVPEVVVRGGCLRDLQQRLRLERVHQVRELDRVLDEEHRDVVADQVPHPLTGVELRRETTGVSCGVRRPTGTVHRGEPYEHLGGGRGIGQDLRPGEGSQRLRQLEHTVRPRTAGVHHPLRHPLMIEVGDLLPEQEILEQGRTPTARLQRVLIVRDAQALITGQRPPDVDRRPSGGRRRERCHRSRSGRLSGRGRTDGGRAHRQGARTQPRDLHQLPARDPGGNINGRSHWTGIQSSTGRVMFGHRHTPDRKFDPLRPHRAHAALWRLLPDRSAPVKHSNAGMDIADVQRTEAPRPA